MDPAQRVSPALTPFFGYLKPPVTVPTNHLPIFTARRQWPCAGPSGGVPQLFHATHVPLLPQASSEGLVHTFMEKQQHKRTLSYAELPSAETESATTEKIPPHPRVPRQALLIYRTELGHENHSSTGLDICLFPPETGTHGLCRHRPGWGYEHNGERLAAVSSASAVHQLEDLAKSHLSK